MDVGVILKNIFLTNIVVKGETLDLTLLEIILKLLIPPLCNIFYL